MVAGLEERSKTQTRWLAVFGSIGLPVAGSRPALETITRFPSGEMASTLPTATGATSETVLAAASSEARPTLVPIKARAPARSNRIEFGTPGSGRAAPATGGVLLISIGTSGMMVPVGTGKELAA